MNFDKYKKINDERMNVGTIDDADGVAHYTNPGCGDGYEIYLKVNDEGIVEDAKFMTTGCGFGLASLALTAELAKGRHIDDVKNIKPEEIEAGIDGYPPRRKNYLEDALAAFAQAVDDYHAKRSAAKN